MKPLQERVGCLMYAATCTRPDLAFFVHQMCQCLQKPTPELMNECDHALSYLSRLSSTGLTYTPEEARLVGYSDASWEVRNSTSGWVLLWQNAPVCWGSRKQKCVALSSCEAEIVALSEAAKDVVFFRKLVSGLDRSAVDGPSDLHTDSKSGRDLSYNPEQHQKTKHIKRRHFFIREAIEEAKICVPFVRSDENLADFFTKPLKPQRFFELRDKIMNVKEPSSQSDEK